MFGYLASDLKPIFCFPALGTAWISTRDKVNYTITANRQLISQEDLDRIAKIIVPEELAKMYANELVEGKKM